MAGNTGTTVQANQTFSTSVVPIAVGVLNPANSAQTTWDCGVGMNYAEMTTVVTGSPASFTILLEGTYDGSNWSTIAATTNVAGETVYGIGATPFTNLRARCTAVSGGSSPTVNVFATASEFPFEQTLTGGTLKVDQGWSAPVVHFNNATTTVTGTVADFNSSREAITFAITGNAGVTAGAVTLLGSIDGVTFVTLTAATLIGGSGATVTNGVVTFTAAGTVLVNLGSNLAAIRWLRADITTNFTGGSATAKSQAF